MYLICSQTAWGCQGAHNRLCDSLGLQGGDFAFPASFLILNEIMHLGAGAGDDLHQGPVPPRPPLRRDARHGAGRQGQAGRRHQEPPAVKQ